MVRNEENHHQKLETTTTWQLVCRRRMTNGTGFDDETEILSTGVNQFVDGQFSDLHEAIVATRVERTSSAKFQLALFEAGRDRQARSSVIVRTSRGSILNYIVNELGAFGVSKLTDLDIFDYLICFT